jgi:hypothetical protein
VKPAIAIVGAGPAGLFAAETAVKAGARVTLYDRMRLPGRKFLLAGRGGLNLTHSEDIETFIARYREGGRELAPFIRAFSPQDLRAWADNLGADTFIGTSERVFPKAMKASPLLRAWLMRLDQLQVARISEATLIDLTASGGVLARAGQREEMTPHAIILALGGASWPELGADGAWQNMMRARGVDITPLSPSNAGVLIDWPAPVRALAGAPMKLIEARVGAARFRGEAMLSENGLEGGAIYAANAAIRAALHEGACDLHLDLQPNRTEADIVERLKARDPRRTLGPWLESKLGLSKASARMVATLTQARDAEALAAAIKGLSLRVRGFAPIARAISSAGGIAWRSVNQNLSLKAAPHVFVCGEMLDWDAPTGGYLLQACFSTARHAALGAFAYACARAKDA